MPPGIRVLQICRNNAVLLSSIMTSQQKNKYVFDHATELPVGSTHKYIMFGLHDGGEVFPVDELIACLDRGQNVIFTHSNPPECPDMIEGESFEEYEIRKAEYLQKLHDYFGVSHWVDGEPYYFHNQAYVRMNNPLVSVGTTIDIAQTHSTRMALVPEANVYMIDPGRPFVAGGSNFYMAMFDTPGGGKVWYWNCGHLDYAHVILSILGASERNLGVAILT